MKKNAIGIVLTITLYDIALKYLDAPVLCGSHGLCFVKRHTETINIVSN